MIFSPYLGSLKCIYSGFILISLCLYCPVVFSVALDDDGCLTSPLGVNMAEFPLEPMLAKMLLVSGTVTLLLQVPNCPGKTNISVHQRMKIPCMHICVCVVALVVLLRFVRGSTATY